MFEIFIPTKIKNFKEINKIRKKFFDILKKENDIELKLFESNFFEGVYIKSKKYLEKLVIISNGEFGEDFFIDYDLNKNNITTLGTKIIQVEDLENKIEKIENNFTYIIGELNSNKLLTNSKKEEINEKVKESFFIISGITFLLYKLKEKTKDNIKELKNYNGKIELKGQAEILIKTSKTKLIEIQANIDKLEARTDFFISGIKGIII